MEIGAAQTILRYASKWEVNRVFAYFRLRGKKLVLKRNHLAWTERDQANYTEFWFELWEFKERGFLFKESWETTELPEEYMQYLLSDEWGISEGDEIYS